MEPVFISHPNHSEAVRNNRRFLWNNAEFREFWIPSVSSVIRYTHRVNRHRWPQLCRNDYTGLHWVYGQAEGISGVVDTVNKTPLNWMPPPSLRAHSLLIGCPSPGFHIQSPFYLVMLKMWQTSIIINVWTVTIGSINTFCKAMWDTLSLLYTVKHTNKQNL